MNVSFLEVSEKSTYAKLLKPYFCSKTHKTDMNSLGKPKVTASTHIFLCQHLKL